MKVLQYSKNVEDYLDDFLSILQTGNILHSNPQLCLTLSEALTNKELPMRAVYDIVENENLFTYLYDCGIDIRGFLCALEMYVIKAGNLNGTAHCFFVNSDPRSVYEAIIPHIKSMLGVFYD